MIPSPEELRAEARRLMQAADNLSDPQIKQELSARALELSQRAEALANGLEDPSILRMNVERYRALLASGTLSDEQRNTVQEMLADAEAVLDSLRKP